MKVYLTWFTDNDIEYPDLRVIGVYAHEYDAVAAIEADGFAKFKKELKYGNKLSGDRWHRRDPEIVDECKDKRGCDGISSKDGCGDRGCIFDRWDSVYESMWVDEAEVIE